MESKKIIVYLVILFIVIFFLIHFENQNRDLRKKIHNLEDIISIYYNPINETGLYKKHINGIKVYSDKNNFSRIQYLMSQLFVDNITYPHLQGIIYYQEYNICDGSYQDEPSYVELYRCDNTIKVRNKSVDELFILAHELGHYKFEELTKLTLFEEHWCDDYALNLTRSV